MVKNVNPKEIKVDFGEIKNDKMRNFRDRIWFIKYWAEFMKKNSDEVWSQGQKDLIDSQFKKADEFFEEMSKSEEGREKLDIIKYRKIKNI
jgi:hypothetical protein